MEELLKKYFGYDEFRKGQREIIENIMNGSDVLAIMPTGAGKSICYQIPALMMDGITVVISPLISLMKDQVDALLQTGIRAAYINSTLSPAQINKVVENSKTGIYKLIYIAPERLETEAFLDLINSIDVSMLAIDEAHCVSQWGHDFRPSYTKISNVVKNFNKRPVIAAFTATATLQVKEDIINLLTLDKPFVLTTGFDRENLYFEIAKPKNKFMELLDYLEKNKEKSGIIYGSTRKTVESIYDRLSAMGFSIAKYHGGMYENERTQSQEDFIYDRANLMVATNAFGMGIDKSNISFVIHYNMPKNMESYYQEAGRAGRDGENAECILFFSAADIMTNKLLIESSGENTDKALEYQKLQEIVDYCNTDRCLRTYILNYFGESTDYEHCDKCGNCNNDIEKTDITVEAQKILSTIKRIDERFGGGVVADVLRGSNNKKIRELGFDSISTYGLMKDYSDDTVKELISFLIAEGYIDLAGDQYPVLKVSPMGYDILRGNKNVFIKRVLEKHKAKEDKNRDIDNTLFGVLRSIRMNIAQEEKVPPFMIFSDATLNEMCKKYPCNKAEMLSISGVGYKKIEKYGDRFINAIQEYVEENNINVDKTAFNDRPASKREKSAEPKADTKMVTYELYKRGISLNEIAANRGLTQSTIEGHLLECYNMGLQVDEEIFVTKEVEQMILEAIEKHGREKLKPLKDEVSEEVSYTAIKFVLNKHK